MIIKRQRHIPSLVTRDGQQATNKARVRIDPHSFGPFNRRGQTPSGLTNTSSRRPLTKFSLRVQNRNIFSIPCTRASPILAQVRQPFTRHRYTSVQRFQRQYVCILKRPVDTLRRQRLDYHFTRRVTRDTAQPINRRTNSSPLGLTRANVSRHTIRVSRHLTNQNFVIGRRRQTHNRRRFPSHRIDQLVGRIHANIAILFFRANGRLNSSQVPNTSRVGNVKAYLNMNTVRTNARTSNNFNRTSRRRQTKRINKSLHHGTFVTNLRRQQTRQGIPTRRTQSRRRHALKITTFNGPRRQVKFSRQFVSISFRRPTFRLNTRSNNQNFFCYKFRIRRSWGEQMIG